MRDSLLINAEFNARASVHTQDAPWVASPMAGVDRKLLDRVGGEVARATSIVRYAAGSRFAPHTHGGGEEFLVLDGVFQDERGDYPAGYYVRNPPGSSHTPQSQPGCTILVKLWQFDADDRQAVHVDTARGAFQRSAERAGVGRLPLYAGFGESVALERWDAAAHVRGRDAGGIELFVLDGDFSTAGEQFGPRSWLRLPPGEALAAQAGASGCTVWIKTGHLTGISAASVQRRLEQPRGAR